MQLLCDLKPVLIGRASITIRKRYLADYVRSNKPEEGSGFGSIALINTQKF
jgi:hypothetical protein